MTATDQAAEPHSWLTSSTIGTVSDAALGSILLVAGALPIWDAGGLSFGEWLNSDAALFPSAVGVAMLAVGVLLLARAAFVRRPPPAPWSVRNVAIIAAAVIGLLIASWNWGLELFLLNFGPPEHAATLVLILVAINALACRSHLHAAGLTLLGLLLGAVGLDSITGQLRLTMEVEQINHGFASALVATGLLVVTEGLLGFYSPHLWLATYAWIVPAWRETTMSTANSRMTRIIALLVVACGIYFGFLYGGRLWDVGTVLALGLFGVACKLLGWNRLVLVLGCFYSDTLEQTVRQTIVMTQGDLFALWGKPVVAALSTASIILVVLVLVLAARSSKKWRRANQAAM